MLFTSLRGSGQGCPYCAHRTTYMLPPSSLFISQGWGLIDLPLRASNEGLLRPRVARAQKIISLHPLFCSASKKGTWPLPSLPTPGRVSARLGCPATEPAISGYTLNLKYTMSASLMM